MFLTADELVAMTGRRTGPAQARVLARLGVKHDVNPITGKVIVYRAVLDKRYVGKSDAKRKTAANFDSLESR